MHWSPKSGSFSFSVLPRLKLIKHCLQILEISIFTPSRPFWNNFTVIKLFFPQNTVLEIEMVIILKIFTITAIILSLIAEAFILIMCYCRNQISWDEAWMISLIINRSVQKNGFVNVFMTTVYVFMKVKRHRSGVQSVLNQLF